VGAPASSGNVAYGALAVVLMAAVDETTYGVWSGCLRVTRNTTGPLPIVDWSVEANLTVLPRANEVDAVPLAV